MATSAVSASVTLPAAVAAATATAVVCWIGYSIYLVRQWDEKRRDFNRREWKVVGLPTPTYIVRMINAGCFGRSFDLMMLKIIKKYVIDPAVKKSLQEMEDADVEGIVPKILCNETARTEMKRRLEVYYIKIERSRSVTRFGKIFGYVSAVQCLENHLALLKLGRNAEVQKEQVVEPVFIVSYPRTATTILHRTMALDKERWKNFDFCDMVCIMPRPAARWDLKGRQQKADEMQNLMNGTDKFVYPGWAKCLETMHGVQPNMADEEHIWYDAAVGHMYMQALMRLYKEYRIDGETKIPGLESKETAKYKYAWLKMVMKIHQHEDKIQWIEKHHEQHGKTLKRDEIPPCPTTNLPWLMKDPNHAAMLPELLDEFEDAKLIFSHRPPAQVVPSFAKLHMIFLSVDYIPDSPGSTALEIGKENVERIEFYAKGVVEFTISRDNKDGSDDLSLQSSRNGTSTRRIDFYFRDLVKDIPGSIEKIYKQFFPNLPGPSDEAKKKFAAYLEANEREKVGNQPRSLKDLHLTENDVHCGDYNKYFLGNTM